MKIKTPSALPESDGNLAINLVGLLCSMLALALLTFYYPQFEEWVRVHLDIKENDLKDYVFSAAAVVVMAAAIIPIIILEEILLKVHRRKAVGLVPKNPSNPDRVAVKLVGLAASMGFIGFFYWALPEYGMFYKRFWIFACFIVLVGAIPAIIYFHLFDSRMQDPKDGYYHLGRLVLGMGGYDGELVWKHLKGWIIKGFFLPLMFIFLTNNVGYVVEFNYSAFTMDGDILDNPARTNQLFEYANNMIFLIDVMFAAVGYVMTVKLLDAHIKSPEPTFFGWAVALVCYPPFWNGLFERTYFAYETGDYWTYWLRAESHGIRLSWAAAILGLEAIYSLATVCLGYRFSNLTYRGIITTGPYRFTKHPAYVAKNLSWWLVSLPFLSNDGWEVALRHTMLLIGLNSIYYLRARTEEAHLSQYPEYVQYGLYMNEHSIFRWVPAILPFVKYRAAGKVR